MSNKRWLISLLAVWFALPASAQSPGTTERGASEQVPGNTREDRKVNELAAAFNVPASEILDLRNNKRMSFNDIKMGLVIADRSGASLQEVVRLHESGMGFKDISKRYNLDWSEVKRARKRDMRDAVGEQRKGGASQNKEQDMRDAPGAQPGTQGGAPEQTSPGGDTEPGGSAPESVPGTTQPDISAPGTPGSTQGGSQPY